MNIDTGAFLNSLPIMGIGLLGIFIVTAVIIIGIYILKALTSKSKNSDDITEKKSEESSNAAGKKESAMDLMEEREKKDFLKTDDTFTISNDL